MKAIFVMLAVVLSVSTSQAALSCGQLISYKAKLANELNWLRAKIRAASNSDKIDLYMDQYEDLYARYQNIDNAIKSDCQ